MPSIPPSLLGIGVVILVIALFFLGERLVRTRRAPAKARPRGKTGNEIFEALVLMMVIVFALIALAIPAWIVTALAMYVLNLSRGWQWHSLSEHVAEGIMFPLTYSLMLAGLAWWYYRRQSR